MLSICELFKITIYSTSAVKGQNNFQAERFFNLLKLTQYKKLAPNALRLKLKFEIWQIKWKKWNKEHQTLSIQFFINQPSILMISVLFFHVVMKISKSNFVNRKVFSASFLYWVDFTWGFYRLNILEQLKWQLKTNNWNLETYRKKLEKRRRKKSLRRLLLTNGVFWSKLWPCFWKTTIGPKMQIMHACHTKMRSKCTVQAQYGQTQSERK